MTQSTRRFSRFLFLQQLHKMAHNGPESEEDLAKYVRSGCNDDQSEYNWAYKHDNWKVKGLSLKGWACDSTWVYDDVRPVTQEMFDEEIAKLRKWRGQLVQDIWDTTIEYASGVHATFPDFVIRKIKTRLLLLDVCTDEEMKLENIMECQEEGEEC